MAKKFSVQKAKASTKQAIRGKLPKGTAGGKRNSRTNAFGLRNDKKNTQDIRYSDHDSVMEGMAVDPRAMKYDYNEQTGEVTERRMTRREELNSILKESSSNYRSPRPATRMDKKAFEE